jgi:hypothetical protein
MEAESAERMLLRRTTLCYVLRHEDEILLAMKKRGFGQGKWNGSHPNLNFTTILKILFFVK